MGIRSLTQLEAEERSALLSVQRYDVEVDLTALPTGPDVRCVSTVAFTCRQPGAASFVDCAAQVVARDAQRCAAAAGRRRAHPARRPGGRQRAAGRVGAVRHDDG